MRSLFFLPLLLAGCFRHDLPICSPDLVVPGQWSRPCRSADEVNSVDIDPGLADLPDPTDLDAGVP